MKHFVLKSIKPLNKDRKRSWLFVGWRSEDNVLYHVGHLYRVAGGYAFAYKTPLAREKTKGFELFKDFPLLKGTQDPYFSPELFDMFKVWTDQQKLSVEETFELLSQKGRRQIDRIEIY